MEAFFKGQSLGDAGQRFGNSPVDSPPGVPDTGCSLAPRCLTCWVPGGCFWEYTASQRADLLERVAGQQGHLGNLLAKLDRLQRSPNRRKAAIYPNAS